MQTLAIIGSGISGLGSGWFLHREYDITVFEAADYIGGHTHTVTVDDDGRPAPIDTGFMVFNHVTYPNLTRLFNTLGVATKPTDMSFSVQHRTRELEYCGSSLNHLFAQRRNLLRPSFYRMLWQIDRFNREAKAALDDPTLSRLSLDEYVQRGGYGEDFFQLYLIPMSSAVWSTPPEKMRQFPAATLLRFFHNHGFLGLHTQHPWWTVEGGAQSYVQKIVAPFRERIHLNTPVLKVHRRLGGGVEVSTATATTRFDKVIFACHAPSTLKILGSAATAEERRLLSAFQYQPNTVTLHTDESVLPRARLARAAWNYRIESEAVGQSVSTHYWMNRLQGVSDRENYFVSVEGAHLLNPKQTLHTFAEEHPLFDLAAGQAQPEIAGLNAAARGCTETYFVGAWQRYGFHEDGLLSAVNLSTLLLGRDPWENIPEVKGSA
ncbi:MAG: FAD-dependent oxidoreductase [Verrucomicrobia bacterium]|nr:FAD-dependent oxidoreductase [Verrucomicrobiota bacterium]